jgi:catalase
VLVQLNRVSNDIAVRVAAALGLDAPAPDDTFYHNNVTANVGVFNPNATLPSIKTLRVGVLASTQAEGSLKQAAQLKGLLVADGLVVTVVGESLVEGVDQSYSNADATAFDGVVVADGAEGLFAPGSKPSPLFPAGRPAQVLVDSYRWGKPVGALGKGGEALESVGVPADGEGVYGETAVEELVKGLEGGLAKFRVSFFPFFFPSAAAATASTGLLALGSGGEVAS